MLSIDWGSPAVYQHAYNISAAGFAWEYLRRDDDYHRDFRRLNRLEDPTASAFEAFSRRWGLRFSTRSKHSRQRGFIVLDAEITS
jgi:hypothetical protein